MRTRIFLLTCACILFLWSTVSAVTYKGSISAGGLKSYGPFTTQETGTGLIYLVFDSNTSDLDLIVGFANGGQIVTQAVSASSIQNHETLELGVPPGIQYYVFVSSFRGSSRFRLSLDCSCRVVSAGVAGTSVESDQVETPLDDLAARFVKEIQRQINLLKR